MCLIRSTKNADYTLLLLYRLRELGYRPLTSLHTHRQGFVKLCIKVQNVSRDKSVDYFVQQKLDYL